MNDNGFENTESQTRDRHLRYIAGRRIYVDWEEFLWDPNDWDEAIAEALAQESGLAKLSDVHWQVITFMRTFYFHNGRAPMNKDLKKGTGMTVLELEKLFPGGIRRGARRVAGLPNPKSCL